MPCYPSNLSFPFLNQVIGILPLVRDLLRQAIHPKQQVMNGSSDTWMEQDYKTEKKKKKKEKKEKKKKMGEPVVFGGRDELALASNTDPLLASSPDVMKDVLSEDPETIRNTIRNGSIDVGKEESLEELALQQGGDQHHHSKKSVSFSGADNNNGNNKKKASKACDSTDDSSSSSSSSSSSEDDAMVTKRSSYSSSASSFGLRPIKPVGHNRIQVKTATGDVYECDRYCPHKGVDLSTWGQVLGNTLVCTKHNWRFGLDGGAGNKGRNIHPCKVNDW
jgi:nitrite reductase/ring-hydroxylating ferredoxin subunit